MTKTRQRRQLLFAFVGASCLMSACSTVSDPAMSSTLTPVGDNADAAILAADQTDLPLPLVMLDRLEQQSTIPVDENPITDQTPEEVAAQEAMLRRRREEDARGHAAAEAAKAAGLCEDDGSINPPECNYVSRPASLQSIIVPRFAAPFQVQFLMNEAGAPTDALRAKFPDLQDWEARHVCGGSLIAPGWAITAAHCFAQPNTDRSDFSIPTFAFSIRLDVENIAVSDAKTLPIKDIIVHPDYKVSNNNYDLALVRFDETAVSTLGDVPWFDGTGVTSDEDRLINVRFGANGIEMRDWDDQELLIDPQTRWLTRNATPSPQAVDVKPQFDVKIWNRGRIMLIDTVSGDGTEIGRNDMDYAQTGVSPDREYIILNNRETDGEIWSVAEKRRVATFAIAPDYFASNPIHFSADGTKFHLWSAEGQSQIRDTSTGTLLHTVNHSLPVNNVKTGPKGQIIIEGLLGHVELLDLDTGKQTFRAFHGGSQVYTDWDDTRLLTWTYDGRVRLFNWQTGEETFHYVHSKNTFENAAFSGIPAEPARIQKVRLGELNPSTDSAPILSAYGWGKTHFERTNVASALLRKLSLTPISWEECNRLRDARNTRNGIATARRSRTDISAFCAIGKGRKTCRGDSGGPLLEGEALVGVVSRGSGACWSDEAPTTFASIPNASEWIKSEICKLPEGGFADESPSGWGSGPKRPELCDTQNGPPVS